MTMLLQNKVKEGVVTQQRENTSIFRSGISQPVLPITK